MHAKFSSLVVFFSICQHKVEIRLEMHMHICGMIESLWLKIDACYHVYSSLNNWEYEKFAYTFKEDHGDDRIKFINH